MVCYFQAFEQELESRQGVVAAMRASPNADHALQHQLDELGAVWDRVNQLSEVREARLQEALKLVRQGEGDAETSLSRLLSLPYGCC